MPQGGVHNHRAIAIAPDGAIFVSSGSTCNVCAEPDPRFATVLRYNPDGSHGRIYAYGLRNASGIAFDDQGQLWAVINERDNLGDEQPPDELVPVKDGGNYGWPYCHAGDGVRVPNPEYGDPAKCAGTVRPAITFQAHSAPLQIAFYHGTQFPARYRGALFIAFHGSWNRSVKTGYKVVVVFFKNGLPDHVEDFATGWLGADQSVSGRPAGVAVGPDGSLYISSDLTGYIYRVSYKP
jgi:glucose/arabinose dehydrogenase